MHDDIVEIGSTSENVRDVSSRVGENESNDGHGERHSPPLDYFR
jgi:hypothetical protein